jgi:hypothetical protein
MGDWSEAMEEGAICRGCALPLGGYSVSGYCDNCSRDRPTMDSLQGESAIDRARQWKKESGQE